MVDEAACGLRLHGRVQGVGFRWWARQRGSELGVAGTIRNRSDGTVEAHLRGAPQAVARMKEDLAEGPPLATVERVEEIPPATVGDGFEIIR